MLRTVGGPGALERGRFGRKKGYKWEAQQRSSDGKGRRSI